MPTGGGATGNPGTTAGTAIGGGTPSSTATVAWGVVGLAAWVTSWCMGAALVAMIGAGVSQRTIESRTAAPPIGTIVVRSAAWVAVR